MILPTGKTNPAFEALDLPAGIFPIFEAFPLDAGSFEVVFVAGLITSKDPVLANALCKAPFCFLWSEAWTGAITGGGSEIGILLSNKLSGILDTA